MVVHGDLPDVPRVVPDVNREEVHAAAVTRRESVEDVLGRQAVRSSREPEREHQGPVEEVADPDRSRDMDLAG